MYNYLTRLALAGEKVDTLATLFSQFPNANSITGVFMLTQARLKEILNYNPNTGVFTWKIAANNKNVRSGNVAGKSTPQLYRSIKYKGQDYLSHRLAWLYIHGYLPDGQIDHINGDRADNRISNLRVTTNSQNAKNAGLRKNNKTGIMGVCLSDNKWKAKIVVNYKSIHLGCFNDFFEACCARKSAERTYGYHFNHGKRLAVPENRVRN